MAELTEAVHLLTGARLSRSQFRAIAFLRWRIFCNSFRRKGGAAELVGRILLAPFLFLLLLGPTLLAGFFAWAVAMKGTLGQISYVFWGTFALTQLISINLGQPGTTFDPTELIRFPLRLRTYIWVRLTFGLLSPSNVVITLMSVAIFVGVTVDRPALWPWTLAVTAAFALANVLFTRMIFAWVDRWLSTRRAREAFTALIFLASLGFQYLNVTFNPGFNHGRTYALNPGQFRTAQRVLHWAHPVGRLLPPELGTAALLRAEQRQPAASLLCILMVLGYAVAFLAIYALRMRTEFRGEALSDLANAVPRTPSILPATALPPASFASLASLASASRPLSLGQSLRPMLRKELLLLRRNTGLLYGLVAPVVMVFLFAGRLSLRGSHWVLPLAMAYALLGLAPMSFNVFGLDGAGAQLYFLAPVPLREVMFAKNLMHFLLGAVEVLAVVLIVTYVTGPPALPDSLFALTWAVGAMLLTTSIGNLRSIAAPKKITPGRSLNRNQSQLSVWIALGLLLASSGVGAACLLLATYLRRPWAGVASVTVFAVAAALLYAQGLHGIERYALQRREILFEELGKMT